jgi:hypothetical protein
MSCWPVGTSRVAVTSCPAPASLLTLSAPAGSAAGATTPLAAPKAGAPASPPAALDELAGPPPEQPASAAMVMHISPGTQAAPSRRWGATMCLFRMPL